jgi:hypothetical protein
VLGAARLTVSASRTPTKQITVRCCISLDVSTVCRAYRVRIGGGSAEIEPGGEQTTSWASTAPYRDQPDQFPPHKTLAALPPEGIVIVVWLSRHPGSRSRLPRQQAPFKIQHTPGSFEGVPSSRATYGSGADVKGRFDVTLWVIFGRTEPTTEQLDRAQAEVDRLQLPNQ